MKLRRNKLVPISLEGPAELGNSDATYARRIERLEELRLEELRLEELRKNGLKATDQTTPLALCLNLPEQLLLEYSELRTSSRLGEVFTWANRFQSQCDRVVFVASASAHRIIKTFLEACCDPLWNELTRGERGSKPRIYFAGEAFDNDAFQGLLRLLWPQRPANRDDPYGTGVVVLSRRSEPSSVQVAKERLLADLQKNLNTRSEGSIGSGPMVYDCLPNTPTEGQDSWELSSAILPFSVHGMLPAAILGINIMELLAGAAWTSRLFLSSAGHENPILRWVAWNHSMESRNLALWNRGLSAAAQWLCSLSEWRVFHALEETPCDKSLAACNHLWVEQARFDSLSLDPSRATDVVWDPGSDRPRSVPPGQSIRTGYVDESKTRFEQTLARQTLHGGKGLTIRLPDLGELAVGQWMQWMIIAQLLERKLIQKESSDAESSQDT